jgi:hypothetical protein
MIAADIFSFPSAAVTASLAASSQITSFILEAPRTAFEKGSRGLRLKGIGSSAVDWVPDSRT